MEGAPTQELAQLTAEPLRPRFSAKFFTGGASGAAAYMPNSSGDGAQGMHLSQMWNLLVHNGLAEAYPVLATAETTAMQVLIAHARRLQPGCAADLDCAVLQRWA